jgi:hypothetical protein
MSMTDQNNLDEYANAGAQQIQPQRGHALVRPTTGVAERIVGAQPVAVLRDEAKVMNKLKVNAAMAGDDWFYRFPVKKSGGGQDYIEGPSIKLANDIARVFGNCAVEVREIDVGDAWTFYARFTDIETGFSMERAYRQRKSQTSMRTRDYERQQDIAYQIGQSKAIRNVIVNSLQIYADFAFREARESLVAKIGKDLPNWRQRTLEGIDRLSIDLARVERVVGRAAKDWLAPDIAAVIAMGKSITDGMATVDETFPAPAPVEQPKPSGASVDSGSTDEPASGGQAASEGVVSSRPPAHAVAAVAAAAAATATAYERGKQAKADGHNAKAIPGEYRESNRTREALAWQAGFSGNAMPTFDSDK